VPSQGTTVIPWAATRVYEYLERSDGSIGRLLRQNNTNVFSREWDLLVLLDACRVDTLQEVSSEPDFDIFDTRDSIRSVGAYSRQWMERTFVESYSEEIAETAYINGNPHSELCLDDIGFQRRDDVWKWAWDDDLGTIPPEPLTDQAIHIGREESPDRMIVHYMQPHFPSIPHPKLESGIDRDRIGSKWKGNIWDRLRDGEIERDVVKEAFEDNLRYVLDDVKRLLKNIDAEVAVMTSDHGSAFGEREFYGHPPTTIDCVRTVPWFETSAEDRRTSIPDPNEIENTESDGESSIEEQLQALGYKT